MRPLDVALVCPYDLGRPGGVQDQVSKLARWLGEAGHRATVIGPGEDGPAGAVLVGPTRVVKANRSSAPISLGRHVWGRVAEAVAGSDVVHVHEPLMPVVSLAALRRASAPVVATLHADASTMVRRGIRLGRPAVRRLLGRAAVVTAVSPVAAAVVAGAVPVRLVPNGIDLAEWPQVPKRRRSVVFVGRDDPRKGLDLLLDAWPAIVEGASGATLDVVGAERAAPPAGVTFHGRVDEEAKRGIIATAAVLAAPNTGGESFGVVLVEGMAAGCAVVASALPGFVHAAGDAARWVAPGDAHALAAAIAGLLVDAAARDDLAGRAAHRVTRFGRDAVLAGYLGAYEDALRERPLQRP